VTFPLHGQKLFARAALTQYLDTVERDGLPAAIAVAVLGAASVGNVNELIQRSWSSKPVL
jgi:hypothetical protein